MQALLSSFALLLFAAPVSAQPVAPPAGTWAQIRNTAIYPVMPAEAKSTSTPGGQPELWNPADVFAYSGGDLVTLNGVLGFLYWGGGHAATPDMSLYFAPFDSSGPRRLTGPYLAPDKVYKYDDPQEVYRSISRNAPPTVTVAAVPKSRHTYSSLVSIDIGGKPHLFCFGGSLYTGAGGGTIATRIFDLSLTYEQAMARPDMGWELKAQAPAGATSSASGWDPKTGLIVTRGRNFWGAYNPRTNAWTRWGDAWGGSDFEASVAMDIEGRRMWVLGDRLAEVVNLDTRQVTSLGSWSPDPVDPNHRPGTVTLRSGKTWPRLFILPAWKGGYGTGPGLQWHPGRKRLIAWVRGQNLLQIDPETDKTELLAMSGVTIAKRPEISTYGRFRLMPNDPDLVVLATQVQLDVYIGRLPATGTPLPGPTKP